MVYSFCNDFFSSFFFVFVFSSPSVFIYFACFFFRFFFLVTAGKNALPEVVFVGRSNVGKSSLVNMLVNRKALAPTSAVPGFTQV